MNNKDKELENKIKLYNLLVDQIQKYNTILWQFPALLSAANFVILPQLLKYPVLLVALPILNFPLIYAFRRMIGRQQTIILCTKEVEKDLRRSYKKYINYIPDFKAYGLPAPQLFFWTFLIFDLLLLFYSIEKLLTEGSCTQFIY